MKCPRCGAETSKQRYCIYCGERLSSHSSMRVQRVPSGVMRMRYRGNISQTSLPEIQKRNSEPQELNLASLSSSQKVGKVSRQGDVFAMEVTEMKDNQESSARESRELQAMLNRLSSNVARSVQRSNSPVDMPVKPVKTAAKTVRPEESEVSQIIESAKKESEKKTNAKQAKSLSKIDMSSTSLDNLNLNLNNDEDFDDFEEGDEYEAHESFFELDESGEQDVSGTIPMPSGSFAKTPSGGFHLIFDSIKSACSGVISRLTSKRKSDSEPARTQEGRFDDSVNRQRQFKYLTLGAILLALIVIIVAVASNKSESETELAAQSAPVAGNEDFAILPLDDDDDVDDGFDFSDLSDGDFSIPELDGDMPVEDVPADTEMAKVNVQEPVVASGSSRLTELRLYEHKDNVLTTVTEGTAYKTKRSCVMRKGPASRFEFAGQIDTGAKIQILTDVEEDWVLETGSVWKKTGHTHRLGPGDQFEEAKKGMKIPQPKGRVISAKNWKYVKAGDIYGYVGPACFK